MNRTSSALSELPEPVTAITKRPMWNGEPAYAFGSLRLESDGTLRRGDAVVHMPPKELAALRLLLAHAGRIVSPRQMKSALWGNVHVTADSLPRCLSSLRARLEPEDCIQTIYKRGYRFTGEVACIPSAQVPAPCRLVLLPFTAGPLVPEHLGHSIAEDAIARLSNCRSPGFSVLARDSVFALADRELTAHQIGQTLHADFVLTGTLCSLGSNFRLRAEMIRIEDGVQIWVEDMLVAQSRMEELEAELVRRLAFRMDSGTPAPRPSQMALPAKASAGEPGTLSFPARIPGDRSSSIPPGNGHSSACSAQPDAAEPGQEPRRHEAYGLFLRGRREGQSHQRHRMQDGLQHLLRATELDPSFLPAKIELVRLCVSQAVYGFMPPGLAADQVRRTARSIPDPARRAPDVLPGMAWVHFHLDRNLAEAIELLSLTAPGPGDPWTTRIQVMLDLSRHRFAEAIHRLRAALHHDPYSAWLHCRLAWALHLDGQAAASVEQVLHALVQFPEYEGSSLYGAAILAFNGEFARALELSQRLANLALYLDAAPAVQAYSLALAHRAEEAAGVLERLQWLSRERFVCRGFAAPAYVALGDLPSALAELRAAEESRSPWFFQMLADPRLKPLHPQPEFARMGAILTRMEQEAARSRAR